MKPTLYLMVGLPGSGKTTEAKRIESEKAAIRFTPDEWVQSLYDHRMDNMHNEQARDSVENLQWQIAQKLLKVGQTVILDWGFWSAKERNHYRESARKLGANVITIFKDASIEELWKRSSTRTETQEVGMLHFTRKDLEEWAGKFEPPSQEELKQ